MLANPAPMSRHSHQPFSSSWDNGHQVDSDYAAAGPSSYKRQPWSPSNASHSPTYIQQQQVDQPLPTPTAHVTANNTTIYTATGRKRKRLQRACVACHKAKRRCDGGLPCSNCDFSGRTCCYSDASGKMVLPTARVADGSQQSPPRVQDPSSNHTPLAPAAQGAFMDPRSGAINAAIGMAMNNGRARASSSVGHYSKSSTESPKLGALAMSASATIADIPPELRRELIGIFFSQLCPFSSVIDEISFFRDLSTPEVSPSLLLSMFALSARFQQNADEQYRFATGEQYARSARAMLSEEDAHGSTALDRPDLDTAMSLCFLAAHELGMGRLQRALSYSSNCVRMVNALRLHEGLVPQKRQPSYSRDSFSSNTVRRNSCQRLVCLAWTLDTLLGGIAGQAPSVRAEEIEAYIVNFGSSSDELTKALISMARVFGVFVRVLDHTRSVRAHGKSPSKQIWSQTQQDIRRCEESLHEWAETLPTEQKFDETNLTNSSQALSDSEGPAADKAWCWAMMHTIAECSMFVLHNDSLQKSAAYNNLLLILGAFGHSGRRSLFTLPALLICTEFPVRPTLNVSRWWNQARECWGLSEKQVAEAAHNMCIARQIASPALFLPLPQPTNTVPKHHSSTSGSMLPALNTLPLPALRLSPPSSASPNTMEKTTLSPIGRTSPTWPSSSTATSPRSPISETKEAPRSPGSTSFEFYASTSTSKRSPPLRSHADPRMAWNPISSLRGEKRTISSITQS